MLTIEYESNEDDDACKMRPHIDTLIMEHKEWLNQVPCVVKPNPVAMVDVLVVYHVLGYLLYATY